MVSTEGINAKYALELITIAKLKKSSDFQLGELFFHYVETVYLQYSLKLSKDATMELFYCLECLGHGLHEREKRS